MLGWGQLRIITSTCVPGLSLVAGNLNQEGQTSSLIFPLPCEPHGCMKGEKFQCLQTIKGLDVFDGFFCLFV